MMRESACLIVLGLAAMAGCATPAPLIVREPVGPQRVPPSAGVTDGDLVVYSASRVSGYAQSEYPVHTAYTIYGRSDQVVRRVQNQTGSFNQDPERVSLPPGEYRVKALGVRPGEVIVPVIIEPGETTVVDLDGTALPQGREAKRGWVRLPDGHVVGPPAACNPNACR